MYLKNTIFYTCRVQIVVFFLYMSCTNCSLFTVNALQAFCAYGIFPGTLKKTVRCITEQSEFIKVIGNFEKSNKKLFAGKANKVSSLEKLKHTKKQVSEHIG